MARAKTRRNHGYTVNPRKDGRWGWAVTTGYDPTTGNPVRIQGTCRTQADATAKALAALAKVKAGAHVPAGKDRTVAAYLEEWLELYVRPHREPKTIAYYEGMVRHHIVPTLGRVPLRKLTAPDFQRLLNEKAKPISKKNADGSTSVKKLSPETIRGIRATLRSALSRAFKDGLVAENIAQRVVSPKLEPKKPQYLSAEQAASLLMAAQNHPLRGLITVALLTGMRMGEATGLRWEDVDLEKSTVRVQQQLQRINSQLTLKRLKSERAHRSLHLPQIVIEALQAERSRQLLEAHANPMGLVFLNPEGRPLDPKYVDRHLKTLMVDAGINPMSFHKLRHTAASLALADGQPLAAVRDQLGHSQIALTANVYAHAVPVALKDVGETLARVMTPGKPPANG